MSKLNISPLEMFYRWESTTPDEFFLRQSTGSDWLEMSYAEVGHRVRCLAAFLLQQNFPAQSRIALLSSNSADWVIADLAIMMAGYVSVPLNHRIRIESARYILEHSESKMLFIGAFESAERLYEMLPSDVPTVALYGCKSDTDYCLADLIAMQRPFNGCPLPDLDTMMTIIYTSGTTGDSKGVIQNHRTPGEVLPRYIAALNCTLEEGERERLLSFLPLSHVAERVAVEMRALYNKSIISFSAGQESFDDEIRSVQPHAFFAVPRLWSKFKSKIDAEFELVTQGVFNDDEKRTIRHRLGLAEAQVVLTGSAPCPPDVHEWFIGLGVCLCEGYGMTENFCDGCFWQSSDTPVLGSVGKPLPGVEISLTREGEIRFRSPGLMLGYYKNKFETNKVLKDGWYHTGDKGRIDKRGNLYVIGRIGDSFKTTKGKFINPTQLESKFDTLNEIGQLCIFGHGKNQPLLLMNLSEICRNQNRDRLADKLLQSLVDINQALAPHERVSQIFITEKEWTLDDGLVTATSKIRRKVLEQRYAEWVEANLGANIIIWE